MQLTPELLSKLRNQLRYHLDTFKYDAAMAAKARQNRRLKVCVMPVAWSWAYQGIIPNKHNLVALLFADETAEVEYLECRYVNFYRGMIREIDVACKVNEIDPDAKIYRSDVADRKHGIDLFVLTQGKKVAFQISINGASQAKYAKRKDAKKKYPVVELLADCKDRSDSIPLVKREDIEKAMQAGQASETLYNSIVGRFVKTADCFKFGETLKGIQQPLGVCP